MKKKYTYLFFGLLLFLGLLYFLHQSGVIDHLTGDTLKSTVENAGSLAPLIYIGVYTLASILFIPGSPITLVGGALFGPLYGTLYTVVGATIGALLAFTIARALGRTFIVFGTGEIAKKLQAYDEKIAVHGFLTVLFLRFVPLFPFNGLNFALGITKVSFKDYALGTFLGIIPGTFTYVYFGDSLASLNPLNILSAVVLVIALSLIGKRVLRVFNTTDSELS